MIEIKEEIRELVSLELTKDEVRLLAIALMNEADRARKTTAYFDEQGLTDEYIIPMMRRSDALGRLADKAWEVAR